ncbi:MAG: hypothetical protein ACKO8H_13800 [Microcystis panniformis]
MTTTQLFNLPYFSSSVERSTVSYQPNRLAGLRRFAIAITFLNILGHTVLGFEQSWAQPLVALATGYSVELLESVDAGVNGFKPRYLGSIGQFVDFLLSAHITSFLRVNCL